MPYHCPNCQFTVYGTVTYAADPCPRCGAHLGAPRTLFESSPIALLGARAQGLGDRPLAVPNRPGDPSRPAVN